MARARTHQDADSRYVVARLAHSACITYEPFDIVPTVGGAWFLASEYYHNH
jgi:hypothetical protein